MRWNTDLALPAPYYLANHWERRIKIPSVSSGVSWFGRVVRLSALSCAGPTSNDQENKRGLPHLAFRCALVQF